MTHAAPLPPITAPADVMGVARANCAARATARGETSLADAYLRCTQDAGWAMRHEVAKLLAEREA